MKTLTEEFFDKIDEAKAELGNARHRSAWKKGVNEYGKDLLNQIACQVITFGVAPTTKAELLKMALCGAGDWETFSACGGSFVDGFKIAPRLCTASELKRTNGGIKNPSGKTTWKMVQAKALAQAYAIIEEKLF